MTFALFLTICTDMGSFCYAAAKQNLSPSGLIKQYPPCRGGGLLLRARRMRNSIYHTHPKHDFFEEVVSCNGPTNIYVRCSENERNWKNTTLTGINSCSHELNIGRKISSQKAFTPDVGGENTDSLAARCGLKRGSENIGTIPPLLKQPAGV